MTVKTSQTAKANIISRVGTPVAVLAIICVLFLGLLTALPMVVKHVATSWLMENGMAEARIDNIDINLFSGSLALEGVELRAESGERSSLERFSLNIALTELLKKHIHIQSLQVKGLKVVVDQGEAITLGGLTLPQQEPSEVMSEIPPPPVEEPKDPWLMGIDALTISQTSLALALPKLALRLDLDNLSLSALHAWDPNDEGRLEIKGAIDQSPLLISLDLTPFSTAPTVKGGIQLTGFSLDRLHRMAEPQIASLRGELTIDTRISMAQKADGGTTFSQTGTLSLFNLGGLLEAQGVDLTTLDLTWLGDLWIDMTPQDGLVDLRSLGRLSNSKLAATLSPMGLTLGHEGLIWDGEFCLHPLRDNGFNARGNLSLTSASAVDSNTDEVLAALARLFVYDIKADGTKMVRTPHLSVKGIEALPPLAAIGSLDVTGIALSELQNLHAETIILDGVATAINRDAKGDLPFLKKIQALTASQPGTEKSPQPEEPAPSMEEAPAAHQTPPFIAQIDTFRVTGKKFFQFSDESVAPAFHKTINLKRFELLGLDTSKPEKGIPLTFEAQLGPYETITMTGTVRPFAPKVTTHLDLAIDNLDLAPLSPYSSQALGYLIETGTFTTKTSLSIEAGRLDVVNALTLNNIELVPEDKEKIDQVMKSLTMPLDFALSILKDTHNTIRLDIPVTGDIDNPDVSVQSIINTAMAKAVTLASLSYLKFLIQPYGTLLTIAQKAGEYATHIRLDPVVFDVGTTLPNPASLDYLKVVAGLMKGKEALKLTICANAVTDDIKIEVPAPEVSDQKIGEKAPEPTPVDPALYIEMARQRAAALRDTLVGQGIDPSRIILCHPHFIPSEEERPEAILAL